MFGEGGGKGATINSFLKSLSRSTATSSPTKSSNGGTSATKSVIADEPKIIGATFSHLGIGRPTLKKSHSKTSNIDRKVHRAQKNIYMDSDDDWDADIDDSVNDSVIERGSTQSFEIPQPSGVKELYPAASIKSSKSSFDIETGIMKREYKRILEDPISVFEVILGPNIQRFDENLIGTSGAKEELQASITRYQKFKKIICKPNINFEELKKLSWNGVPSELRPVVWSLLLGYLSTNGDRRVSALKRKRQEYLDQLKFIMAEEKEENTWHQISIDIPRTNPHIPLYGHPQIQRSLENILYLWAVRHPASGYVQGINDICTPFFQVFLAGYVNNDKENSNDIGDLDPSDVPSSVLDVVEADTYWCLTKLLDSIQDNYIHAQPGIIRQVNELRDLTARIDSSLAKHLDHEGIEFLQFSFRWINCLLMREVNMVHIIRMWDTYLTEGSSGFSEFHIYVCAAFLVKWSDRLKDMDFQEIMIFLQSLPTKHWGDKDIELLLSEAYMWQTLYKNASAHLKNQAA